jgi:6-phosphofructokinase
VGAVLSGGQAPGGHNVLSGIFDALKRAHPDSVMYGFRDGPRGVFKGEYVVIDEAMMNRYRNMGGAAAVAAAAAAARARASRVALDACALRTRIFLHHLPPSLLASHLPLRL